ncbi:hypothetical protein DPX16_18759 [Anabarilius grahami]|uniref:Nuclease HARBI1 n=1 Tax=Anabarilius grahami TaxID=495550 RepID=A0A3N0Y1R1_ANAGA|nr:hypothetical protein DPX16_18759 [Anabarilius grahami]
MTEAACLVLAVLCLEKRKKRKKTRTWTRSWLARRGQYGLSILQRELEDSDKKGFRDLLRMDVEDFSYLLDKVTPFIQRRDTKLRRAISARMWLSLTLGFLATGETFRSLSFQYRIGRSTVSEIVMETCQALYDVLKDDLLKTSSRHCFADVVDANHNMVPGAWRREGELPSVAASGAWNARTAAKNYRDNLKAYFL